MSLLTDSCAELLPVNDLSCQNVLWNFYRIKDTKKRLTLMDNPHFYAELPKSQEIYEHRIETDPVKDLWQLHEFFYILTDRQELVYIMTDQVTLTFGNFWRSKKALIFKGLSILVVFIPLFLMSSQTPVGCSMVQSLSRHLPEAHIVGSVNRLWHPRIPRRLFQELLGIVVICNRLSLAQRDVHRPGNV